MSVIKRYCNRPNDIAIAADLKLRFDLASWAREKSQWKSQAKIAQKVAWKKITCINRHSGIVTRSVKVWSSRARENGHAVCLEFSRCAPFASFLARLGYFLRETRGSSWFVPSRVLSGFGLGRDEEVNCLSNLANCFSFLLRKVLATWYRSWTVRSLLYTTKCNQFTSRLLY